MSQPSERGAAVAEHIDWLDGLRGIAALWVLLSHVQILCGMAKVPLLSWGGLAVDLFMMLSGFLMAHHYRLRQQREPWAAPSTWGVFWLRRFFRIAPLYYLALVAALALGPWIGEQRDAVAAVWPGTGSRDVRYHDASLTNLLLHLSFVFGALPQYAFRTALPDWSIGLEMQFYLAFPFVMLAMRGRPLRAGLLLIAGCLVLRWRFGPFLAAFPMPSFLPLKLYVFVAGIWVALCRGHGLRLPLAVSLAVCGAVLLRDRGGEAIARVVMVALFFWLMDDGSLSPSALLRRWLAAARRALSGPLARWAGETSYGLYLVHLLVLIPVAGGLAGQAAYVGLPPVVRFGVCGGVAGAISYLLAWVSYRMVERPGIAAGRRVHAMTAA